MAAFKDSAYVWTQNVDCINHILVNVEIVIGDALFTTVSVLNCFVVDNSECLIAWHVHVVKISAELVI